MTIPSAQQSDDLQSLVNEWGQALTWTQTGLSGSPFSLTAIIDEGPIHSVPTDRGITPLISKRLSIITSHLPTGHDFETARLTIDSTRYRIVRHQPEGLAVNLELQAL